MAARRGARSNDTDDIDSSTASGATEEIGAGRGPYDIDDLAADIELGNSHLDLGSVLVPVVEGGQVTVEMTADHQPQAVYLVTPHGRISVAAFAAPRSPGMWREVVGELVESLQSEGAETEVQDGHWGREVVASVPGAIHRFIGVDGPRWMVRCVCSGPPELADELTPVARAVLSESVVRRGNDPHPPRDALPVILPAVLAEQVAAAQEHMANSENGDGGDDQSESIDNGTSSDELVIDSLTEGQGAQEQIARAQVIAEPDVSEPIVEPEPESEPDAEPESARRSSGSALQRLRRRQGR